MAALDQYGEVVSVRDFATVQEGINILAANGGGVLDGEWQTLPVADPVILRRGVYLARMELTLAAGVNTSVVEGDGFQALTGTNSSAGVSDCGLIDVEIDGNRDANDAATANAGHGAALYGRDFVIERVTCRNTRRSGLWTEYGNATVGISPFNVRVHALTCDTTGEHGWVNKVSDLHFGDINIRSPGQNADDTYYGLYFDAATHGTNVNVWRGGSDTNSHRFALYASPNAATSTVIGAILETGKTAQIGTRAHRSKFVAITSYNLLGLYHAIVDANAVELDLVPHRGGVAGQADRQIAVKLGDTTSVSYCRIQALPQGATGGLIDFARSAGANDVRGSTYLVPGAALFTGTPHAADAAVLLGTGASSAEHQSFIKLPSSPTAVKAAGSTAADAAILTRPVTKVTSATSTQGVRMRSEWAAAGVPVELANSGITSVQVYPHPGGRFLGLAVDAAIVMPANAYWRFMSFGVDWAVQRSA